MGEAISHSDRTHQTPHHLSCSDLGRAQNAGPTESAPLRTTRVPEPEWLRPGRCMQPRAGLRRFPLEHAKEGNGTPLQYSCLQNPMGGGAWSAAVHGVTKSRTRLSDLDLGGACHPGPALDGSRRSNLEPEQCGQGGHTRREWGQVQCG